MSAWLRGDRESAGDQGERSRAGSVTETEVFSAFGGLTAHEPTSNPFFDQTRDGCMKAAKEIGGVQCLFIGPADATEQEQVQVVQDLITKHVDGIGVSAAKAPAIAKVLARAKEAKIPVVTWDSDLLPADKGLRASYIGTVNEQVGIAIAKQAMALKPNGGTYCIQTGGPAAANMNDRIKGMAETLLPTSGSRSRDARSTTMTISRCRSLSSLTIGQISEDRRRTRCGRRSPDGSEGLSRAHGEVQGSAQE